MPEKSKKVSTLRNLKIYLNFVKKYKFTFIFLLLVSLIIEIIHVGEKYIFKVLVDKGTEFSNNSIGRDIFVKIVIILAIAYLGTLAIKSLSKWLHLHFINVLESNLILDLKRYYFNHILGLSHGFHVSNKTGSLISRLSRGGGSMERMTDTIVFNFAPLIFQLIIAGASIIYFDLAPALVLLCTIIVFIIYNFYMQRIQREANLKANFAEDVEKANIADIFMNVDTIKYFGKEDLIKGKFAKLSENTRKARLKYWHYFRWLDAGQGLILGIGTILIVYFPLMKFLSGEMTLGTLVFIYTVYLNLLGPLFSFVHGLRDYYRVMIDFEDLFNYGYIERDVKDKPNAKECIIKNGEIDFNNISFNYGNRKILSDFSLKINQNEKIALVGHSGSGKTTLLKLLYRLYDVNKGTILVDGEDIRNFKQESLRGELSIVAQEGILFDDTIYNNIAFSNPKATRKQVFDAIKFAQLDEFIKKLPNKENTIVGERGVKLSGGEKQRVSIARAILANKKILVLDEATSSLDSQTEFQIQQGLWKLMEGRTTIIIAHRLSTIMRADKIVVLDKGKIVQMGKHADLIRKPGMYKQLWNLQKGGYIGE